MKIELIAFTQNGMRMATDVSAKIQCGNDVNTSRCGGCNGVKLSEWTAENFTKADALIFVGAMGICVRAIAQHIKSKIDDPAVIVIDENGKFVISVLSGHIGGANLLAESIAKSIAAIPVITTATDIRGAFAIDSWAVQNGYKIENAEQIKIVSSKILNGETVKIFSDFSIEGSLPIGLELENNALADVVFSAYRSKKLTIVPQILVLGIGCKKNTTKKQIEIEFNKLLTEENLSKAAFLEVHSIDLKSEEQGLIDFCMEHNLNTKFYSAQELMNVQGEFSSSDFVMRTTGASNVCERAAALSGGKLIVKRRAANGVTLAVAKMNFTVKF